MFFIDNFIDLTAVGVLLTAFLYFVSPKSSLKACLSATLATEVAVFGRFGYAFCPEIFASHGPILFHPLRNCHRKGLMKCRTPLGEDWGLSEAISQWSCSPAIESLKRPTENLWWSDVGRVVMQLRTCINQ